MISIPEADAKEDSQVIPSDMVLAQKLDHLLWGDEFLRITDYQHLHVTAIDGRAILHGHVVTAANKARIERTVRSVPGVKAIENQIVLDDELVNEVAQAIDQYATKASVRVYARHGVIYLGGILPSAALRTVVEAVAATIPQVRGVVNYIQAPGVIVNANAQDVVQPTIGEKVYMMDLPIGAVEQVVINPMNRRVTDVVVDVHLPDPQTTDAYLFCAAPFPSEHRILLSLHKRWRGFNSKCDQNGIFFEGTRYVDFNPLAFVLPPVDWQPPYPYRRDEVLFCVHP